MVTRLTLVKRGGFVVETCASGMQALEVAPAFVPHLILLDVMMPGMDGPTTLSRLRALEGMSAVPVVFMTAKVQPHEVQRYLDLGAPGVVTKPFDQRTLVETITETWGGLAVAEPDPALPWSAPASALRKEYGARLPALDLTSFYAGSARSKRPGCGCGRRAARRAPPGSCTAWPTG